MQTSCAVSQGSGSRRLSGSNQATSQSSQNAILNWHSFSIGAGNSVVFQQPSASAVALNRALGSNVSEIFGSLTANGQLFLVNPNGVLFDRGAHVEVGGIVASTPGIRDSDLMSGRYVFTNGGDAGSVVNVGNYLNPLRLCAPESAPRRAEWRDRRNLAIIP